MYTLPYSLYTIYHTLYTIYYILYKLHTKYCTRYGICINIYIYIHIAYNVMYGTTSIYLCVSIYIYMCIYSLCTVPCILNTAIHNDTTYINYTVSIIYNIPHNINYILYTIYCINLLNTIQGPLYKITQCSYNA